jgi:hypothetical protein
MKSVSLSQTLEHHLAFAQYYCHQFYIWDIALESFNYLIYIYMVLKPHHVCIAPSLIVPFPPLQTRISVDTDFNITVKQIVV